MLAALTAKQKERDEVDDENKGLNYYFRQFEIFKILIGRLISKCKNDVENSV